MSACVRVSARACECVCVCVCVRVCVCVCVLLAASILNVVDGSLKLKKGSLNSGPIEFFLWKKNTIVES